MVTDLMKIQHHKNFPFNDKDRGVIIFTASQVSSIAHRKFTTHNLKHPNNNVPPL
jgi:hypothetical protein